MTTQTVYRLTAQTSFRDLRRFDETIPTIAAHEVLIKMKSVALNYRDVAISNGTYPFSIKNRLVPCSDGAGEVVEVGHAVIALRIGDAVIGNFDTNNLYGPRCDREHSLGGTLDGVLREYVVLPEYSVTKIPKKASMTYPEMASLVCAGVTAWNALYGNIHLKPGQTVLLQGRFNSYQRCLPMLNHFLLGTGGVSITGLLLAKAAGAITIITSSSDEKLRVAKDKYGADHGINYKTHPDWAKEALALTDGRGVDYILENGGSGTIAQSIQCIAFGGIISVIGFLSKATQLQMPDVALLVLSKGCVVRGINVGSKQLMEDLVLFIANKKIKMPVEKLFTFSEEDVLSAFELVSKGDHMGKVCISLE